MKIKLHIYPSNLRFDTRINKSIIDSSKYNYKCYVIGFSFDNKKTIFERSRNNLKIILSTKYDNKSINILLFFYLTIIVIKKINPDNIHYRTWTTLLFFPFIYILNNNIKSYYDIHEYESKRVGYSKFKSKIIEKIENIFLRKFDKIIVVNEKIANQYKKRLHNKVILSVRNIPSERKLNDKFFSNFIQNNNKKYDVVYCGLINESRSLEKLLIISHELNLSCLIIGEGDDLYIKKLMSLIKKLNVNVTWKPYLKLDELRKNLMKAKFGWNYIEKDQGESYKFALPNKFFHYLMSGLPVLNSINSYYLSNIIMKNDLGEVVYDSKNLKNIVKKILNEHYTYFQNINEYLIHISKQKDWRNYYENVFI